MPSASFTLRMSTDAHHTECNRTNPTRSPVATAVTRKAIQDYWCSSVHEKSTAAFLSANFYANYCFESENLSHCVIYSPRPPDKYSACTTPRTIYLHFRSTQ